VQAKVGDGTQVRIIEQTTYPFDETVNLTLAAPKPVRFPLILRIPGWCAAPRISVNGKPVALSGSGAWATIERTWLDGDRVRLELPMTVRATVWARNRNTVSIDRGPLTYSLRIGEKWQRAGGTDEWPGMEVYPTTPWNYGLEIDPEDAASSVTVERREGALPAQPFGLDAPPLTLRARGRRIPGWVQEPNGMVGEVQPGPVRSDAPLEEITLVPMGSARLRITAFPRIDNGPAGRDWRDGVPLVLASHSIWQEPPTAASDDVLPANSSDRSIPRFSWADHRGTVEWIEYRYSKARMLSSAEVYWAADDSGCQLPAGWRLLWWDGTNWQPVRVSSEYETARDRFSRVRFEPVTTMRLRLEARLRGGAGAGILEWRTE
jgi:hypothetical protein